MDDHAKRSAEFFVRMQALRVKIEALRAKTRALREAASPHEAELAALLETRRRDSERIQALLPIAESRGSRRPDSQ